MPDEQQKPQEGSEPSSGTDDKEKQAADVHLPEGEVIYRAIRSDGDDALRRTSGELGWSGLAAGMSMGFSLAAEGALRAHLPEASWTPLVSKLGYSVGFLIVILGRQQLFTEQTLTAILPLLSRDRTQGTLANVTRLWAVVLLSNLIGAALFAAAAAWTPMFPEELRRAFAAIGHEALSHSALTTVVRAIPAGFLIALMVWLLPGAGAARLWIVVVLTYVVGIIGAAHVIAGAAECLFVVFTGERTFGEFAGGFLLPAFVGNSAAGVTLVAALAHAQHAPEESA